MKDIMLMVVLAISSCAPATASLDVSSIDCTNKEFIHDGKAYRYAEVKGECLLSNEWSPVNSRGYTKEYNKSEQYQNAEYANNKLREWREK